MLGFCLLNFLSFFLGLYWGCTIFYNKSYFWCTVITLLHCVHFSTCMVDLDLVLSNIGYISPNQRYFLSSYIMLGRCITNGLVCRSLCIRVIRSCAFVHLHSGPRLEVAIMVEVREVSNKVVDQRLPLICNSGATCDYPFYFYSS